MNVIFLIAAFNALFFGAAVAEKAQGIARQGAIVLVGVSGTGYCPVCLLCR